MKIQFSKYQGTGNDFVIINNLSGMYNSDNLTTEKIELLCNRRFGIGADGLMLLQRKKGYDFEMKYYNSDGNESTMCGNGGRCIVAFAWHEGVFGSKTSESSCNFIAVDGHHKAIVIPEKNLRVNLKMQNVKNVEVAEGFYYLDTGSPHYVEYKSDTDNLNVYNEGRKVRYNKRFKDEGTNVNFVEITENDAIKIRTYERGVEDETYSCGTGSVAAAITAYLEGGQKSNSFKITTKGGNLKVTFEAKSGNEFENVWLEGAATFVFKGEVNYEL